MKAKKILALVLAPLMLLSAAGCGSLFSSEYYYSAPYREEVRSDGTEREVKNYITLKSAIMELIQKGEHSAQFRFGSYTGSLMDDLAAVCLEIKTSTPLGAYAVENISYDTSRIVSYYTADIEIEYKKTAEEIASIETVNGLGELGSHILSAMSDYSPETVVRIYSSAASEDYIRALIRDSYYADPFLVAELPDFDVFAYPDSGTERIYRVDFRYSAMPARLREMDALLLERTEELALSLGEDEPLRLALRCADSLAEMCANTETASAWEGTAYGSIIEGDSSPEGLAMAYKALCEKLGVECEVVLGERRDSGGAEHAWNIIGIDGDYYHVDVSRFHDEPYAAFLLSDEDLWGEYDWDRERYPVCDGALGPGDVFQLPQDEPEGDTDGNEPTPPQESPEGGETGPTPTPELPETGENGE